jgi:hypothetical protein
MPRCVSSRLAVIAFPFTMRVKRLSQKNLCPRIGPSFFIISSPPNSSCSTARQNAPIGLLYSPPMKVREDNRIRRQSPRCVESRARPSSPPHEPRSSGRKSAPSTFTADSSLPPSAAVQAFKARNPFSLKSLPVTPVPAVCPAMNVSQIEESFPQNLNFGSFWFPFVPLSSLWRPPTKPFDLRHCNLVRGLLRGASHLGRAPGTGAKKCHAVQPCPDPCPARIRPAGSFLAN